MHWFSSFNLLRMLLLLGVIYYLIGGITHFFGLTIFPFYVAQLYSPYHDTVIALAAFSLAIILFIVGKDPIKNIEILNGIIICGFLAIIFSVYILLKIDFPADAADKKIQTIIELILLVVYTTSLALLKPKVNKS